MIRRAVEFVLLPFCALYLVLAILPVQSLWFAPGPVRFLDAPSGGIPELEFTRVIKHDLLISYHVVVREARIPPDPGRVVCEGDSAPFVYKAQTGPVVGADLAWWVPEDDRCKHLPDGAYWADTCWTVHNPLGDLLPGQPRNIFPGITPNKVICRVSPAFYVGPRPEASL